MQSWTWNLAVWVEAEVFVTAAEPVTKDLDLVGTVTFEQLLIGLE